MSQTQNASAPQTVSTTISTDAASIAITTTEYPGSGGAVLLLHGGAGPISVSAFGQLLSDTADARVVVPTHPGFGGTPRPESLSSPRALAELYSALIDELGLDDVTVIGNSIGGWVAAELALVGNPRIGRVVIVDGAGLALDDHPAPDFFSMTLDQVTEVSYFEPARFRIDLSTLPDAAKAVAAGNRAALQAYTNGVMSDPTLLERLPAIGIPSLVVWGAADGMFVPEHGEAYAAAIPGAEFDLIETAGHLPQLETPERLRDDVVAFIGATAAV